MKIEKWECGVCGKVIDYCNVSWVDTSGVKHIVCDTCNEALAEEYDEEFRPDREKFVN